jgi:hypothetical protein
MEIPQYTAEEMETAKSFLVNQGFQDVTGKGHKKFGSVAVKLPGRPEFYVIYPHGVVRRYLSKVNRRWSLGDQLNTYRRVKVPGTTYVNRHIIRLTPMQCADRIARVAPSYAKRYANGFVCEHCGGRLHFDRKNNKVFCPAAHDKALCPGNN